MMTCDAIRNRLLAEPDPTRVPAELRPHVAGCAGCREFLVRYESLAKNIAALAAPQSDLAKMTFVDSLANAGPIIKSLPSLSTSAFSWKQALRIAAKPLAATAAAVAVGVGIWSISGTRRPAEQQAAHRHELLKKVVEHNAALARLSKPSDARARIEALSDLAVDLRTETHDVALVAPKEDLDALAGLFENAVNEGLVKQARKMDTMNVNPMVRKDILQSAADKLAAAADDANALSRNAPQQAKAALDRIADAATKGRSALLKIANEGGA
jgi:hypothetical protein